MSKEENHTKLGKALEERQQLREELTLVEKDAAKATARLQTFIRMLTGKVGYRVHEDGKFTPTGETFSVEINEQEIIELLVKLQKSKTNISRLENILNPYC